jgi:hypothetical protein
VTREELGHVFEALGFEDRQVAPVDDVTAEADAPLDEPSETRVELGRASCDVDGWNPSPLERANAQIDRFLGHHLGAVWPCVDVAVSTRLVAELSEVYLQHFDPRSSKRREAVLGEYQVELAPDSELAEPSELEAGLGKGQATGMKAFLRGLWGFVVRGHVVAVSGSTSTDPVR